MLSPEQIRELVCASEWDEVRYHMDARRTRNAFRSTRYDDNGLNPFHMVCCSQNVPLDVIRSFAQVDKNSLTRKTKDTKRVSPLHLAASRGSARTVRMILTLMEVEGLDKWRELSERDGKGQTPLAAAWGRYRKDPSRLLATLDGPCPHRSDLWKKTVLLLCDESVGERNQGGPPPLVAGGAWSIVRTAAGGVVLCRRRPLSFCPRILLQLALRIFPEQAQWVDGAGRYPLHHAADGHSLRPLFDDLDGLKVEPGLEAEEKDRLQGMETTAIEQLLRAYPQAAMVPDKTGRLPLHLAAESCKCWEGEVISLVEAAPQAMEKRDAVTGLYPFMLAATGEPSSLDVVYELLRASPSQVEGGIRRSVYEIYLEEKLAGLQKQLSEK